jgi:hypothetical protein
MSEAGVTPHHATELPLVSGTTTAGFHFIRIPLFPLQLFLYHFALPRYIITIPSVLSVLHFFQHQSRLQKPMVAQLINEFPAFYGTRRLITVNRKNHHWHLY